MKTTLLTIVLPALILFFFLNLAAREMFLRLQEKKKRADREEALAESLRLDFTRESKTLRRVEVKDPEARILCVDDEEVILNSFWTDTVLIRLRPGRRRLAWSRSTTTTSYLPT